MQFLFAAGPGCLLGLVCVIFGCIQNAKWPGFGKILILCGLLLAASEVLPAVVLMNAFRADRATVGAVLGLHLVLRFVCVILLAGAVGNKREVRP